MVIPLPSNLTNGTKVLETKNNTVIPILLVEDPFVAEEVLPENLVFPSDNEKVSYP